MVAVADGGLRDLADECLGVAQQQAHQGPGTFELGVHALGLEPIAPAGTLNHGTAGRGFTAHEHENTQHALVADDGHLGHTTVFQHVKQGHNRAGGEVHMA